jgi:AcrR family transcriptional regulator
LAKPKDESLRDRLVEAATAEFATFGYAGTTLDGIAIRAGVTKGGVYFHFRGKEELFFAVLDHWRKARRQQLQVPAAGAGGGAAALRLFLAACFAFHFEAPAVAHLQRVLATELRSRFTARLREDERQEMRWLRAACRDLLLQGAHDGTLFVDDPAFAAFQLAAAVRGALEQWQTAPADVEAFCNAESLAQALVSRYATGVASRVLPAQPNFDFGGASPT